MKRNKFKPKDYKIVDVCKKCGNQLPKYSPHHFLCKTCWEERQLAKGNLALLGGVK